MNFQEGAVKMITQLGEDEVECLVFPFKGQNSSVDETGEIVTHKGNSNWLFVGVNDDGFFMTGGEVRIESNGSTSFVMMKPVGFAKPDQEMYNGFQEDIEEAKLIDANELVKILSKL